MDTFQEDLQKEFNTCQPQFIFLGHRLGPCLAVWATPHVPHLLQDFIPTELLSANIIGKNCSGSGALALCTLLSLGLRLGLASLAGQSTQQRLCSSLQWGCFLAMKRINCSFMLDYVIMMAPIMLCASMVHVVILMFLPVLALKSRGTQNMRPTRSERTLCFVRTALAFSVNLNFAFTLSNCFWKSLSSTPLRDFRSMYPSYKFSSSFDTKRSFPVSSPPYSVALREIAS